MRRQSVWLLGCDNVSFNTFDSCYMKDGVNPTPDVSPTRAECAPRATSLLSEDRATLPVPATPSSGIRQTIVRNSFQDKSCSIHWIPRKRFVARTHKH